MTESGKHDLSEAEMVDFGDAFSSKWGPLPKGIWDFDLNSKERDLYLLLSTYYNFDSGEPVFPSQKALSKRLDWSTQTVRKYLRRLEDKGLVVTTKRTDSRGMYTGNSYKLKIPTSGPQSSERSDRKQRCGRTESSVAGNNNHRTNNNQEHESASSSSLRSSSETDGGSESATPNRSLRERAKRETDYETELQRAKDELGQYPKLEPAALRLIDHIAEANKSGHITKGRKLTLLEHILETIDLYGVRETIRGIQVTLSSKQPGRELHKYARAVARNTDDDELEDMKFHQDEPPPEVKKALKNHDDLTLGDYLHCVVLDSGEMVPVVYSHRPGTPPQRTWTNWEHWTLPEEERKRIEKERRQALLEREDNL